MTTTSQIAKHLREVHFGVNWTWANLRDVLNDVDWKTATHKEDDFNSIIALVYHVNYYIVAIKNVLLGNPLTASDKYSFSHPEINSEDDWKKFQEKVFKDAEELATLIEQYPDSELNAIFDQEKYGTYLRNFLGVIEHFHYHLGQIVILKKVILNKNKSL